LAAKSSHYIALQIASMLAIVPPPPPPAAQTIQFNEDKNKHMNEEMWKRKEKYLEEINRVCN